MKNKNLIIYGSIISLFIGVILFVSIVNVLFKAEEKEVIVDKDRFNIVNTWYVLYDWTMHTYTFNEDGTYTSFNSTGSSNEKGKYELNDDGRLILSEEYKNKNGIYYNDAEYDIVEYSEDKFKVHYLKSDYYLVFYRNKDKVMSYDPDCENPDKSGFCIEDKKLISYIGNSKTVKVPSYVTVIGDNAFAGDMNRALNTESVLIPGNVKKVESSAFAFTRVNEVIFEEGVEELGGSLFMDTCIEMVEFPKSIKKVGGGMFSVEEYCSIPLKIYLHKGSYMDNYFKDYEPDYYNYEIIYK